MVVKNRGRDCSVTLPASTSKLQGKVPSGVLFGEQYAQVFTGAISQNPWSKRNPGP